ncbi:MAG: hypothetical protein QOE90_1511 [Thermoplasmata archaeon]|jgi:hypothetical protein|nr:hypothetical protein [Thermoplasmata archaeon]
MLSNPRLSLAAVSLALFLLAFVPPSGASSAGSSHFTYVAQSGFVEDTSVICGPYPADTSDYAYTCGFAVDPTGKDGPSGTAIITIHDIGAAHLTFRWRTTQSDTQALCTSGTATDSISFLIPPNCPYVWVSLGPTATVGTGTFAWSG